MVRRTGRAPRGITGVATPGTWVAGTSASGMRSLSGRSVAARLGPMAPDGRGPPLLGRAEECAQLERLLDDVRAGSSAVLVVRGEPGIGKTALLNHVAERAADCRVVRVAGVESEMEIAFAGLHQLCAPLLRGLERLPPRSEEHTSEL